MRNRNTETLKAVFINAAPGDFKDRKKCNWVMLHLKSLK